MAISPISSVSFRNNYGQINFMGRKEEHRSSNFTNTLKAIPLATIIAMSPMVGQAQTPQEKCLITAPADKQMIDPSSSNRSCEVRYISNDGNDDNVEIVRLVVAQNYRGPLKGYDGTVECVYTKTLDVNTLEVRNITSKDGTQTWKEYYAWGPATNTRSLVKLPDGTWTGKGQKRKIDHLKLKIAPEMYEYLKNVLEDEVEYKNTNETDNGATGIWF